MLSRVKIKSGAGGRGVKRRYVSLEQGKIRVQHFEHLHFISDGNRLDLQSQNGSFIKEGYNAETTVNLTYSSLSWVKGGETGKDS